MAWVTGYHPTQVELEACIQCGLCLPYCPTFRVTGLESQSPRGRLHAMSAFADGDIAMDQAFDESMSTCLQCRACEPVCPALVPFGRAMEGMRAELAEQGPVTQSAVRRSILGRGLGSRRAVRAATAIGVGVSRAGLSFLLPRQVRAGVGSLRPGVPGPTFTGQRFEPAADSSDDSPGVAALLAGCVMDAWFGTVHEATIGLLTRAGYEVVVPEAQTCCGALAAHDGAADEASALARRNLASLSFADIVVANAAGCSAHLKGYGHWTEGGEVLAAKARDVTEVVADLITAGRLPTVESELGDVAVQDPCHMRHAQRITSQPRAILQAAGYRPVEIDPVGMCCGAAGIYSLRNPEMSSELGLRKAEQVRAAATNLVASANPGCEMQMRAQLGESYRIAHPVELYWEAISRGPT